MYGSYCDNNNEDMQPIRTWMDEQNGKIVYAATPKLKQELEHDKKMRRKYNDLREKGKLKMIKKQDVDQAARELKNIKLASNDGHIIALAQAAKVTLLVSADVALHADFKKIVGGHIYQNKTHAHLLTADTCP